MWASAIGIWIYDAQMGEELNFLTGKPYSFAFSPDGTTLASGIVKFSYSKVNKTFPEDKIGA